jgi:hypothetical protein
MGKYSLSEPAAASAASALRTADQTTGRSSSSRYAPTPRFSFFGCASALKRAVRWKMTVGGMAGADAKTPVRGVAMFAGFTHVLRAR